MKSFYSTSMLVVSVLLIAAVAALLIIEPANEESIKPEDTSGTTTGLASTGNDDSTVTSGSDTEPTAITTTTTAATTTIPAREVDNEWAFFLVNKQNYLPEDFSVELEEVNNSKKIDVRCAEYARQMISDAEKAGIYLTVISGYRSLEHQRTNLENFTQQIMANGYTRDEAYELAIKEIAPPGASEHNAGIALDILGTNRLILSQDFDQTKEFEWLYENSWKYGFIMRYAKGKSDITGYIYEPWHYRFIGLYHAEMIYETGLCLEEYMEQYG